MGSQDAAVARQVDRLRRDGSLVARFNSGEEAAAWRAAIRRACRAAGLRIRTGLANADERIAWVYHVDHTLTEAGERAARRAMETAYNGEPRVPFHQLVREEQRKILRVVRDNEEPSDSELGGSELSKPQVLESIYNYDRRPFHLLGEFRDFALGCRRPVGR
jgi:hypothetical protein